MSCDLWVVPFRSQTWRASHSQPLLLTPQRLRPPGNLKEDILVSIAVVPWWTSNCHQRRSIWPNFHSRPCANTRMSHRCSCRSSCRSLSSITTSATLNSQIGRVSSASSPRSSTWSMRRCAWVSRIETCSFRRLNSPKPSFTITWRRRRILTNDVRYSRRTVSSCTSRSVTLSKRTSH